MMGDVIGTALKTESALRMLSGHHYDVYVERPIRVAVIILVALIFRAVVGRTIKRTVNSTRDGRVTRRLAVIGERAPMLVDTSEAAVARRSQRAATVGTVLRSLTNVVIGTVAFITVLGEFDISLAPIIASAGIVGVAVGFGAQNVVKDFLSGLFLVIEDTFGVGDTVDLGPSTGTVEWIGLRSTRIRDVHGTLWSIRNGEITRVANYSQVWQRTIVDLLILDDADLLQAKEVALAPANEVVDLPRWSGVALERPSLWGVESITAQGVMLRLVVRRRPNQDDFDRFLREALVRALSDASIRMFAVPGELHLVSGEPLSKSQIPPPETTPTDPLGRRPPYERMDE
jgi:small-conductance mechanosensitive channel